MPSFAYTALDSSGQQTTGTLSVSTKAEAYRKLEAQRLTPIKVSEEASDAATAKAKAEKENEGPPPAMKRAQLILFTEELADLMEGGLQLEQALRVMNEKQDSPVLRKVSGRIREQLREGAMFSKALQNASPSFDDLYCNLAAAGEASGSLPQILRRLCNSITQMHELQSRVVSAMVYPAFLIGALVMLMTVFTTVLVPQLTSLLAKSRQKLPLVTELLISFSSFVATWWWLAAIIVTASFLLFRAYIATPQGRFWWDRTKLGIPLFGPVLAARFYAGFAGSLGNLVNNGVPLLNGLKLTARSTTNVFLKDVLLKAGIILGEGSSLSGALRKIGSLPVLLVDMIAMGEQTGRLGHSLEKIANRYDKDLDKKIKRLTSLITPVILILMFLIVGVVAYAIVTSIFQAMTGIKASA